MKQFLVFLIICYCVYGVFGDPYNCAGTQIINPPADINTTWYYPSTWNNSMPAPQYAASQNCTWIVNVPKGMFAYFASKANTNQQPILSITDSIGYVTKIQNVDMEPFYLMDPSFTVQLQVANTIGYFGMRVQWYQVKQPYPGEPYKVASNSTPLPLYSGAFDNGTVVQAQTRVSLVTIASILFLPNFIPYMRITQVYDGPNINSKYVGNLYQIMASNNNFVSSGNSLFLYSLFPGFISGYYALFQDYSDVKQFKTYKGIQCLTPDICQVALDASKGPAAAIRFLSAPFFVKEVLMPATNKLTVYSDCPIPVNRLADYTSTTAKTNIPQKFRGKFTTFVLNQDQAVIKFSSSSFDAKWSVGFNGRRGFFNSPNYGVMSANQNFTDQVIATKTSNVSFSIDRAAIGGNAKLHVTIFDGNSSPVDNVYSASNFPAGPVWSRGDNILVQYEPNGWVSTGAFVNFGFDEYNSARTGFGIFSVLLMTLFALL